MQLLGIVLTFQVNVIWQCTQLIDAIVTTTTTANTAPADFVTAMLQLVRHKRPIVAQRQRAVLCRQSTPSQLEPGVGAHTSMLLGLARPACMCRESNLS